MEAVPALAGADPGGASLPDLGVIARRRRLGKPATRFITKLGSPLAVIPMTLVLAFATSEAAASEGGVAAWSPALSHLDDEPPRAGRRAWHPRRAGSKLAGARG